MSDVCHKQNVASLHGTLSMHNTHLFSKFGHSHFEQVRTFTLPTCLCRPNKNLDK